MTLIPRPSDPSASTTISKPSFDIHPSQGTHNNNEESTPWKTPTHPKQPSIFRLLYRGSLIPCTESDIALEGICFIASLPPLTPSSIIQFPLALSLESMRGRPSLRIMSTVPLGSLDGRLDESGNVRMYIHPDAVLTRQYFDCLLCHEALQPGSLRTRMGVKISLGDEDEEGIFVFGEIATHGDRTLNLAVARILPPKVQAPMRHIPRPDDPLPRVPMFMAPPTKGPKRSALQILPDEKRQKSRSTDTFKEQRPTQKRDPVHKRDTKKSMEPRDTGPPKRQFDVFGELKPSKPVPSSSVTEPTPLIASTTDPMEADLTTANKAVIKKVALSVLTCRGIPRENSDFKEIFGWVTRGAGFALRKSLAKRRLEREEVRTLVVKHVDMYVPVQPLGETGDPTVDPP